MKQLPLNYPPLWIERRLGRPHVAFSGRFSWRVLPFIAFKLGFGVSYLPEVKVFDVDKDGEMVTIERSSEQIYRNLTRFMRSVRATKSLQIRNSTEALDYSSVGTLRNIVRMSFFGPIANTIDVSKCHKLESLMANDRSASKIIGLSDLKRLQEIHVKNITQEWLAKFPNSLKILYLSGSLPKALTLKRFTNLDVVAFENMRTLAFETFKNEPSNASHLVISNVKNITGLEKIGESFPKTDVITVKGDSALWLAELKQECKGKIRIIV